MCRGLVLGRTDKETASEMGISTACVRIYIGRAFKRFGVNRRIPLALKFAEMAGVNFIKSTNMTENSKGGKLCPVNQIKIANQSQLAKHFGLDRRNVRQLLKSGAIRAELRDLNGSKWFLFDDAIRQLGIA